MTGLSPSASARDAEAFNTLANENHKLRQQLRDLQKVLFADYVPPVSLDPRHLGKFE